MMETAPIYDIWRLLSEPRDQVEAEIRALCRTAYCGDHTALARVLGRYKIYVDTRDTGIAAHLMLDGFWEMWVTEAMLRAVRSGATVIDVGANLGFFTLLLADLTGHAGRVLSFEPNDGLAGRLASSIAINGFGAFTTLHRCALGAAEGLVALDVETRAPGGGRVREDGEGTVAIRRLDSFPEALDAAFIKIDVEGHEQQVWRGMTGILARGNPLTIFMEFTVSRYPDPAGFLSEILGEGFALGLIHHDGQIRPIIPGELLAGSHQVDHMLCLSR
jgi:FkbM family methyltransferase